MNFPFNSISNELLSNLFHANDTQNNNDLLHQHDQYTDADDQNNFTHTSQSLHDPLLDVDPDIHFYNTDITSSQYYSEHAFTEVINSQHSNYSFSTLHMNIRSIPQNLPHLEILLQQLNRPFSVIAITETWLHPNNAHLHSLPNYKHEFICRTKGRGGGVSLFIHESIPYKCRPNLTRINESIESIFVEIESQSNNLLLGATYRPPRGNIEDFTESLLALLHGTAVNTMLAGDFNINILKGSNLPVSNFLNTLHSLALMPTITKPTRLLSQSLIDNIYSSHTDTYLSGITCSDISDHCPIFLLTNFKPNTQLHQPQERRTITEAKINTFFTEIQNNNWDHVYTATNAQDAFTAFHSNYHNIYSRIFTPSTSQSVYKSRKPWLTTELKRQLNMKNKLYKKFLRNPSPQNMSKYKEQRNKTKFLIRKAEREHYHHLITANKSNMKKTWNTINDLLGRSKSCGQLPKQFIINNSPTSDRTLTANHFNNHFATIAAAIHNSIPATHTLPTSHIPHRRHSMYLNETTPQEIFNITITLKDSSPGWDDLHIKVYKRCIHILTPIITNILNHCIRECIFPSELKIAKIIPIYKSGPHDHITNYRPIAMLPFISKIFEKLLHKRMLSYIDKFKILFEQQFGFRPGHSTSAAITHVINHITQASERGEYTVGLFLDLSKAFDCIDFDILFDKLFAYGFRGPILLLIKSYLSNRHQFVHLESSNSTQLPTLRGVPQGSVLGPLLFLLYVNDLHTTSQLLSFTLYADDTNILISGTNLHDTIGRLNSEIPKITHWFNANKLALNVNKTHYVIFRPGRSNLTSQVPLMLNGTVVKLEKSTKFLGVILDSRLKFCEHITYINNKIAKNTGILAKLRKSLPLATLVQLYNAFILPYILYCIELWGSGSANQINATLKLQKRCCRLITNSPPRTPSQPLFTRLKILPISTLYKYALGLFTYKLTMGTIPRPISILFTYLHPIDSSSRTSRNAHILKLPRYHLQSSQLTLPYTAAKLHNTLRNTIDYTCSLHTFKQKLKLNLMSHSN